MISYYYPRMDHFSPFLMMAKYWHPIKIPMSVYEIEKV